MYSPSSTVRLAIERAKVALNEAMNAPAAGTIREAMQHGTRVSFALQVLNNEVNISLPQTITITEPPPQTALDEGTLRGETTRV